MKLRHEHKHIINLSDIMILRTRLSAVAKRDKHANPDGTYTVKSLYFDSYTDRALREKLDGVNPREKFRIRYYNCDTSFIRLEKKSKINGLCAKESVNITEEQCQMIIDGDIAFLIQSPNKLLNELYAKMQYGLLRPRCIVTYTRESFVYPIGNVRITLDYNIGRSLSVCEFLNPDNVIVKPGQNSLVEVKYDQYLPEVIRNAVSLKSRRQSAFSKYSAMRF